MADDLNVDTSTQADSTTTDQQTGSQTTGSQTPVQSSAQVAAPDRKAEDERNRGILADLQKERRQRQEYERQNTEYKTQLEQERRRVQIALGVNPKSPEDAETEEIRQRILKVMPELAGLTAEDIQSLRDLRAESGNFKEAAFQQDRRHGRQMLDQVTEGVSKELGGKLTPRQQARLERAYVAEAESNPEFLERHDAGDVKLIAEFVKEWVDDFFEPARRKVTQSETDRFRRVPNGRDRSVANVGEKKIDVTNATAVEDLLVAGFKERGGRFGR